MSPLSTSPPGFFVRFPRVSGDEPGKLRYSKVVELFSPRERG